MKKKIIIIGGILILIISSIIIGFIVHKLNIDQKFLKEYEFAVIDTTSQLNKSFIYYYDDLGKKVYEKLYKMGYMGDTFSCPQVYNNKVYVTPWGTAKERELTVILEIDKENGNYKTYDTTLRSINSLAITDKYFFAVNNFNGVSKLARTNRETEETTIKEFPKHIILQINIFNNILYAFASLEDTSELIEIDLETMEEICRTDVTKYGECPPSGVLMEEGSLYFTLPFNYGEDSDNLLVYDTKTKEIKEIKLPDALPCQLLKYQQYIIISHINNITDEGNSLSILDIETGKIENYQLENTPSQIYIKDNFLYSLDITDRNICRYELVDNRIKFIDQIFIDKRDTDLHYFLTGLYFN